MGARQKAGFLFAIFDILESIMADEPDKTEKERRFEAMKAVRDGLIALTCPLADERRANKVFPVVGEGRHMAEIMFIGKAPGKNEDATGKPFCGASGKFLSEL